MSQRTLFSELKRRNVFGMLVLYVIGAWVVVQVADSTFPAGCIPESSIRYVLIAVLDNDPETTIQALRTGIRDRGLRMHMYFDEPIFDAIRSEPGFIEVRKELDDIIAVEHEKVLQLICFNNPVPNEWRPLPATCEGVVERPAS